MHSTLVAALFSSLLVQVIGVQATQCNATNHCPSTAPCCSEFGFCGDEHFCLGGCNPLNSFSLDSCKPNPLCQDAKYTFTDNSRILSNSSFFDGNISEYDWVVDKGSIMNTNSSGGELALLLTETNGGTRISSTRYVHYGKITASLKTGKWGGVVTAFITMSDIKDEIDWEFPGAATTEAQTNHFWQGVIPEKTAGTTQKDLTDTFSNYHDYTIDWKPDQLDFAIDGTVVHTLLKSDTQDPRGVFQYPSTPSRVQLSIWPAGIEGYPKGTVEWAGGMIDWNDPDYKAAGQFYALVRSIQIECSDPQPPTPDSNITSYVYGTNSTVDTPSIAFSNASVLLNGANAIRAVKGLVMSATMTSLLVGGVLGGAVLVGLV